MAISKYPRICKLKIRRQHYETSYEIQLPVCRNTSGRIITAKISSKSSKNKSLPLRHHVKKQIKDQQEQNESIQDNSITNHIIRCGNENRHKKTKQKIRNIENFDITLICH